MTRGMGWQYDNLKNLTSLNGRKKIFNVKIKMNEKFYDNQRKACQRRVNSGKKNDPKKIDDT